MLDKTIQIFATDFQIRNKWPLPFIRIGTRQCNSIIHCKFDIDGLENKELPISEANSLFYISKHLEDFGNPDYVGLCHYRRYFTASTQYGILPIKEDFPASDLILSPLQQLLIILQQNVDGILPFPFQEHFHVNSAKISSSFYEEAYFQGVEDKVLLSLDDYKLAFDLLVQNSPDSLQKYVVQAFEKRLVYFGTIFTLKTEIFKQYQQILLNTLIQFLKTLGRNKLLNANCRCGGYLLERMSSCLLWAYQFSGKKFLNLPLIVASFDKNPDYRIKTTAELGLKCDIESI